ncbi:MAG: nuclear transport factor 2 family protein [Pseudomonadota bacterium]
MKIVTALLALLGLLTLVVTGLVYFGSRDYVDQVAAYQAILQKTENRSPPAAGSAAEAAALTRIRSYFGDINVDSVKALTASTYASDAWLNDTLVTKDNGNDIEQYFLETAEKADSVNVDFDRIVRDGDDYYLHWTMRIRSLKLNDGQTLISVGMSHMRLDEDGLILMHQDFWDSSSGLFVHLPVVGSLTKALRNLVAH